MLSAVRIATSAPASQSRTSEERHATALVLDYVWGPVAETLCAALQTHGLNEKSHPVRSVEIGGSGAGSVSVTGIVKAIPVYMQMLVLGEVTLDVRTFPPRKIADAWVDATRSVRTVVTAN